jgi:DinB family protein
MSFKTTCRSAAAPAVYTRSSRLAERLARGARDLADFARSLSEAEWHLTTPGDGRGVGVIVHHVATVYPLEVGLAQLIAAGTPIVNVTWSTVHEMNAAHAVEHAHALKPQTLALLAENSAAAAEAVSSFSDDDLDCAVAVSLYGDAQLTCQFMLEDHAVRHSYHHLARLRGALAGRRASHSDSRH